MMTRYLCHSTLHCSLYNTITLGTPAPSHFCLLLCDIQCCTHGLKLPYHLLTELSVSNKNVSRKLTEFFRIIILCF